MHRSTVKMKYNQLNYLSHIWEHPVNMDSNDVLDVAVK